MLLGAQERYQSDMQNVASRPSSTSALRSIGYQHGAEVRSALTATRSASQRAVRLGATYVLAFLSALALAPALASAGPTEATPRGSGSGSADEVYGRLVAPCCWNQTLDVHDSELATTLRLEVATRLSAGEPALSIEDDLARRYGERVRAVPRGNDTRTFVGASVFAAMAVLLIGLCILAQRWVRRGRRGNTDLPLPQVDDEDDDRYDRALNRALEEHRPRR
jgi:cytochrome c-type biogenesis protein CcmH